MEYIQQRRQPDVDPSSDVGALVDPSSYRSMVGGLLWISRCTRPDIAFTVGYLGRQNATPTRADLFLAQDCIVYLHSTKMDGLFYQSSGGFELRGYSDSDYSEHLHDRRSTTGFTFFLNTTSAPVSWRSKLQGLTTRSSTEAEYVACSDACQEAVWILGILQTLHSSIDYFKIYVDNQAARALAHTQMLSQRTKHIDIRYHYCRDIIKRDIGEIHPVDSKSNCADILTKFMDNTAYNKNRRFLHLTSHQSST